MLLALWREAQGRPYDRGYLALAQAIHKGLRSVERTLGVLKRAGFIGERKRFFGGRLEIFMHPGIRAFAIAEQVAPSGSGRRGPRALPLRLRNDSLALLCAAVRRSDGRRYLPVPYVVGLLSEHERAICEHAAAVGAGPLCPDITLSNDLLAWFRHVRWWDEHANSERARATILRDLQLKDDDPHFIEDRAA